ncbi:hypothetical protein [Allorhizocola rhizosphaerae]|uniref:hypothetical protein n=1 Tax=Allorhizocola rhizosphaerae TaxID=1872709 RepID=UPI001B8CDBEE|nr:hypothetical protein [Allorhizocola rhizosphaerae]
MSAAPAAATEGWFVHSGGYPGDVFGDMPCLDKGAELKAKGEIQDYYCRVNDDNGLWDLWVIQGTWVFHSRHGDLWDCDAVGYAQVTAGNAYTYDCRLIKTPTWYFDLYLILT